MLERHFVDYCAPTLAGLKDGSLFSCDAEEQNRLLDALRHWNRMLIPRGIRIVPLRWAHGRCLLWVYRISALRRRLQQPEIRSFLAEAGYQDLSLAGLTHELRRRVCTNAGMPHEIGLFLGYPLEDVAGFIQNNGRNCTLCGLWKVYGSAEKASACFERCRKCTATYRRQFEMGRSILELTVAQ